MKNRRVLKILLLILLVIIISFVIYLEREKIENRVRRLMASSEELTLCSNQYYKTKYDIDGKIIIDGWASPAYSGVVVGHTEEGAPIYTPLEKIKDLTCVQKLDFTGACPTEPINPLRGQDLNNLKNLNNVEELYIGCNDIKAKDINQLLSYFPKLEKLDFSGNVIRPQDIDWNKVKKLEEVVLDNQYMDDWYLIEGKNDWRAWPKSLKRMAITCASFPGEKYNACVLNLNKLKLLSQLEELNIPQEELGTIFYSDKEPSWLCDMAWSMTNLKRISGVTIYRDVSSFDCSRLLNDLKMISN